MTSFHVTYYNRIAPSATIPLAQDKIASMNIVLSSIILVKYFRLQILGKIYADTTYFNLKILPKN